ncbi:MAG: isoamylase early set domain-containing protein [Verrucomicrobiales bacterium]|nr:isoamylase early set domain-containing protein [Verrucomicrobiales bacterium]
MAGEKGSQSNRQTDQGGGHSTEGKQYWLGRPDRYSAKRTAKPVQFMLLAPYAKEVYLMGDFNNWDPRSIPMQRQPDGGWRVEVTLPHGHHRYLFVVDGEPVLDPRAYGVVRDAEGRRYSLIAVS